MTQFSEAVKGSITGEMKDVAGEEGITPEKLMRAIAKGRAVIPFNPIHSPKPTGIGERLSVKVNANIGSSMDVADIAREAEKARVAKRYGAHAIMDLSTGGDINAIRRRILKEIDLPLGTVPVYQAGIEAIDRYGSVVDMGSDDIFDYIRLHAKDGVDFMTVHCGVTKEAVERLKRAKRVCRVVSRGGSFLIAWMLHNGEENPLYSEFDYLLEMAGEFDVTLSLGDGLRPGAIADASDGPQIQELITLGELVRRARVAGVQSIVEGPGHLPMDQVEANVLMEKRLCDGAPFYVLGPIVTDVAPGYDHIVGAIGGALAAYSGADFLCYVTPSEHLALPTAEDVEEGVIASRIAAHAADLARGRGNAGGVDLELSTARANLDWERQISLSINPVRANRIREERGAKDESTCTMCGALCALKLTRKFLDEG
jgi:phosphomethylpyrimidine synthase